MSTTFTRRPLTALVLSTLAAHVSGKPVGDMVIPPNAGWSGVPNAVGSTFTPYVVLVTLSAAHSAGSFGESQGDWQMPFMLESFGASRDQCEWMADMARTALDTLAKSTQVLGANTYKVQQIRTDSIGAVNRVAVTDPPFYGQQDGITLWLAKEPV